MTDALTTLLAKGQAMTRDDLRTLLGLTDPQDRKRLYDAAYEVKARTVGRVDYYRGLLEFSNRCIKNCKYCGIRRDNEEVERFDTDRKDLLAMAKWAYDNRYGSLTLQSGERQDEEFIAYVEGLLRDIKELSHGELGITLCVGEQTEETYRRWFQAGAHRYLLRIETSNPALYATLHPQDGHHEWSVRKACLEALHRIGYQVGTGVMIGLPGQTLDDLAGDILFYRDMDIDMIGMGPYVVHHNTPIGKEVVAAGGNTEAAQQERFILGLNMIAVTRLFLPDRNIAATTALQALNPLGRELGLKAGANILMPIVTLPKFRPDYLLYDNKPCVEDSPDQCRNCLAGRVASVGDTVGFGKWGDSLHYFKEHPEQERR
ncbi:[FeFe] hydrogenase H-cluster radical SAM maturase HydE [Acidaminococcus timonensis]|uniref:[FeFe] hydrogenase H-cluster radical SAM maturase HydE n=1 Tax=Acidaminococcus timonensis TaxID=1871002 RepID=UPI0025E4689C|nr:[FeFe] hydrogenase H-cluster radical SAM maturase HydE [Acidaminococcus timonensis]